MILKFDHVTSLFVVLDLFCPLLLASLDSTEQTIFSSKSSVLPPL